MCSTSWSACSGGTLDDRLLEAPMTAAGRLSAVADGSRSCCEGAGGGSLRPATTSQSTVLRRGDSRGSTVPEPDARPTETPRQKRPPKLDSLNRRSASCRRLISPPATIQIWHLAPDAYALGFRYLLRVLPPTRVALSYAKGILHTPLS